ncbi:MAG: nagA [Paenibacillus sp.]|nr:nagA [Paenibacillus sp.]
MKRTVLKHGAIYTPTEVIDDGYMILSDGGQIEAIGRGDIPEPEQAELVDCSGKLIVPGLIDVHVHGGGGYAMHKATFADIDGMSRYHARFGTTAFLPTTATTTTEAIIASIRNAVNAAGRTTGAQIAGIHLEGPYLNSKRKGAIRAEHIRLPDPQELRQFVEAAAGYLRIVTLAPEIAGGMDGVRRLNGIGIAVSIGHSDATYEQVRQAVQCGASQTTHHFNGMSPFHHREPGVAGAGLLLPELTTELICDGVHVHPGAVKLLFEMKTPERVCLITDSVICAGMPDGIYEDRFLVRDGIVSLVDGSSLAGSSLTMLQALKNAIRFTGYSLEKLLPSATAVPAKQAQLPNKGSLAKGKDADFLILTPELDLQATYVLGTKVYEKGGAINKHNESGGHTNE